MGRGNRTGRLKVRQGEAGQGRGRRCGGRGRQDRAFQGEGTGSRRRHLRVKDRAPEGRAGQGRAVGGGEGGDAARQSITH